MDKIEEIKDWLNMNSDRLPYDARQYFPYLFSHISTLKQRVNKLKKAIKKHKSLRREKGMLWSSVDEELYKAKDEICGE